jgi:hypothetical protein
MSIATDSQVVQSGGHATGVSFGVNFGMIDAFDPLGYMSIAPI